MSQNYLERIKKLTKTACSLNSHLDEFQDNVEDLKKDFEELYFEWKSCNDEDSKQISSSINQRVQMFEQWLEESSSSGTTISQDESKFSLWKSDITTKMKILQQNIEDMKLVKPSKYATEFTALSKQLNKVKIDNEKIKKENDKLKDNNSKITKKRNSVTMQLMQQKVEVSKLQREISEKGNIEEKLKQCQEENAMLQEDLRKKIDETKELKQSKENSTKSQEEQLAITDHLKELQQEISILKKELLENSNMAEQLKQSQEQNAMLQEDLRKKIEETEQTKNKENDTIFQENQQKMTDEIEELKQSKEKGAMSQDDQSQSNYMAEELKQCQEQNAMLQETILKISDEKGAMEEKLKQLQADLSMLESTATSPVKNDMDVDLKQRVLDAENQLERRQKKKFEFDGTLTLAIQRVVYKGQQMLFPWDPGNIQIEFYDDGLPAGVTECTITIAIVKHEDLQHPDDTVPASFAYLIKSSCELSRPVKVRIGHFATEDMKHNLIFARGSSETTPYVLYSIESGIFSNTYGEIYLQAFSFFEVLFGYWSKKSYLISLKRSTCLTEVSQSCLSWKLYLFIIQNSESQQKLMESFFERNFLDKAQKLYPLGACVVHFQESCDCIEIKGVSKDEEEIYPGWFIEADSSVKLLKSVIDSYSGERPPACEMTLTKTDEAETNMKKYSLRFKGIENEQDHFIKIEMVIYDDEVFSQQPHLQNLSPLETYRRQIKEKKRKLLLDEVSDEHIRLVAEKLENWEDKIDIFGLDRNPHLSDIKEKQKLPLSQRIELLHEWRKNNEKPTYENLLQICANGSFNDSAKVIVRILNDHKGQD